MIIRTLCILFLKVFVVEAITYSNCQIGNDCHLEVAIFQAIGGTKDFIPGGNFKCLEKIDKQGFMGCLLNSAKELIEAQSVHYASTCSNCEKQTLKKLNDALVANKGEWFNLNSSQLHLHLEKEGKWFQRQSPDWKRLLVNQAMAKLAQQDLALGIDKIITKTKEIIFGSSGHLNADILTGDVKRLYTNPKATMELLEVQSLFKDMEKGLLGQLYPTEKSKKFICTVFGTSSQSHVKQLIDDLQKRLSKCRAAYVEPKEIKACDLGVHHFSGLLIFGSFVLWKVALAMQGKDMDFDDSKFFITNFRALHADYDIACTCSKDQIEVFNGMWRTRWRQTCYQVFPALRCENHCGKEIKHRTGCDLMCYSQWDAKGFPSPQSREEDRVIWKEASKCNAPVLLSDIRNTLQNWHDHSVVNYTNWALGEPSLQDGCVYYVQDKGTWKMEDCLAELGYRDKFGMLSFCFLCERKVWKIIEELPEIKLVQPYHQEMPVPSETLECDNNGTGKDGPGKEIDDSNVGPGQSGCDADKHSHLFLFSHFFLTSIF